MALPVNVYTCQVRIPMTTGVGADAVTNTFHLRWDGSGSPAEADFLAGPKTLLNGFYTAAGSLLSAFVSNTTIGLKVYEAWNPPPREPVYLATFTGITKGGVAGVPELSMVMSFQGAPAVGVSQARRRNRIYLGPLGFASSGVEVPAAQQDILRDAGQGLLDASDASANWTWVAASPTGVSATPVTNGWVDNAWDIQRRRGWLASTRLTFE